MMTYRNKTRSSRSRRFCFRIAVSSTMWRTKSSAPLNLKSPIRCPKFAQNDFVGIRIYRAFYFIICEHVYQMSSQTPESPPIDVAAMSAQAALHAQQLQLITSFWQTQLHAIETMEYDYKTHSLPLARIKKVMKVEDDMKVVCTILIICNLHQLIYLV